jgi:predicted metal-dependent enzyme (double-stranded beta helix superfamily)
MLDLGRFVEECRKAASDNDGNRAVREVVAREVANANSLIAGLGEPVEGGSYCLYQGPDLTILNVIWPPHMTIMPHNHDMWAVIGVYAGREDNIFWRRLETETGASIEAAGAKSLGLGEVSPLGRDIIHSVTNPTTKYTAGIHVYGGDFYAAHKSEWEPETLVEGPFLAETARRLFAEADERSRR